MKNYQVIAVSNITIDIDFGNEIVKDVNVIALAFQETEEGELKVKAVTRYDLIDGFVMFSHGDYDLVENINKVDVNIK